MKMKANKIEATLLMLVSIYISVSSYKNHIAVDGFLSAGLFPFMVGVLMFILSCSIFIKDHTKKNNKSLNCRDVLNMSAILLITFILFFISFNKINFYILSSIYIIAILLLLKERNKLYFILMPIITNICIYLIFSLSLKIIQ